MAAKNILNITGKLIGDFVRESRRNSNVWVTCADGFVFSMRVQLHKEFDGYEPSYTYFEIMFKKGHDQSIANFLGTHTGVCEHVPMNVVIDAVDRHGGIK
ncbi:hypothetical protein N9137_00870 [Pseudomonadales bacterium]|nr:hypothetical protein [Pseudomonadales bacterium]